MMRAFALTHSTPSMQHCALSSAPALQTCGMKVAGGLKARPVHGLGGRHRWHSRSRLAVTAAAATEAQPTTTAIEKTADAKVSGEGQQRGGRENAVVVVKGHPVALPLCWMQLQQTQVAILDAIKGAKGRGKSGISQEQLERLELAVAALEADGGVPAPVASPLLEGRWRLLFTTRPGTASPIQRTFTGVERFSVFQVGGSPLECSRLSMRETAHAGVSACSIVGSFSVLQACVCGSVAGDCLNSCAETCWLSAVCSVTAPGMPAQTKV